MPKFTGSNLKELVTEWGFKVFEFEDYSDVINSHLWHDKSHQELAPTKRLGDVYSWTVARRNYSFEQQDGYHYVWDGLISMYEAKKFQQFKLAFMALTGIL